MSSSEPSMIRITRRDGFSAIAIASETLICSALLACWNGTPL